MIKFLVKNNNKLKYINKKRIFYEFISKKA